MKGSHKHSFSFPASLLTVFIVLFLGLLFSGEAFALQQGGQKKPQKVTAPAPVPKTGEIISYAPGDDGDLQAGVEWPVPRFIDNGNGTVTDRLTMLMWTQNTHAIADTTWSAGVQACNDLVFAGYDDWRMPNIREIASLFDFGTMDLPAGHPFIDPGLMKWTSNTVHGNPYDAWGLQEVLHYNNYRKDTAILSVWPVRGPVSTRK